MILPIIAYGNPILRKKCENISRNYNKLNDLISNMWDTMYASSGVGLAAPQIGLSIRIFIVDASPFSEDEKLDKDERLKLSTFKKVFINPELIITTNKLNTFNEGCLSIPDVREDVIRENEIIIKYYDENFTKHELELNGLRARVVQHEFDHIEGILFTDKLSTFKKKLIKGKLNNISKGKTSVDYRMRFPNVSKKRS